MRSTSATAVTVARGESGNRRARSRPWRWAALAALASSLAACGTVCEDAATMCGFDETAQPDDCAGVDECAALCIIDWDGCDVNDPASEESQCIARCLEQGGEGG